VRAYIEIAAIWNEGPTLDLTRTLDEETLLARIRSEDNVIALDRAPADSSTRTQVSDSQKRRKRWRLPAAVAAAVLLAACGTLAWFALEYRTGRYSTDIGERRSITLTDGSTLELNSRSRVRVRFREHERAVELLEGQALFRIARDHARPFIVTSDTISVRAVGTEFDVYRKRSGTVITVVEGKVAVLPNGTQAFSRLPTQHVPAAPVSQTDAAPAASIFLSAGEQVTVAQSVVARSEHPDIASATAWTQRQIVFESASLAEVAEEFNRYNVRQLVIDDPRLNDVHISGVFDSSEPTALLRFLRERGKLHIAETDREIRISSN
jgi:transmembrane sensor